MRSGPILAVAGPALAHLTRVLAVADVLREQGQAVLLATDGVPWIAIATQRGIAVEVLPPIVSTAGLGGGSLALPAAMVHAAIRADIELLRRIRPRLVLLDWRPSMRTAAAICGVPVAAIVNAQVTRHYAGRLAAPARHPITRIVGQRLADRLMPLLAPVFFRRWARPYQQVARAHGCAGWPDLRDYLTGDITLYPDLPSLAPTRNGGTYIGPLIQYPLPATPLPPLRDPVLYVTIGSLPGDSRTTSALAAAIAGWPGSVVATRGGRDTAWPESWISVEYTDPLALTQAGDRVAWVYHGGNGSSYQLLTAWADDPARCAGAVALPFHVEQDWNATRLARLGVVRAIHSFHYLDRDRDQVRRSIAALQDTALLPMSPALAHEIAASTHAARRAAQELAPWM